MKTLLIADADATANIGDLRYNKWDERMPQLELSLIAAQQVPRTQWGARCPSGL